MSAFLLTVALLITIIVYAAYNIIEIENERSARQKVSSLQMTTKLYRGDCLWAMKRIKISDIKVDVVITDPPYGVDFKEKMYVKNGVGSKFDDDHGHFCEIILPRLNMALDMGTRSCVFSSDINIWDQRKADAVGAIHRPASSSRIPWGFNHLTHILFYGKPPKRKGSFPLVLSSVSHSWNTLGHPCSKPLEWMLWLVKLATLPGETVLDPFMGSGTTGVACKILGRNFIGIELDKGYFGIAKKRINETVTNGLWIKE